METKVTVLTPHGRRQIVKVSPNTTLLKVLEEVCAKQGFPSDDYTLKHHNKEVSLSQTFRFSGLPNNCQLEMSETNKKRIDSTVDICLQFEDGSRKQDQFKPSNNLWEVVEQLAGDIVKSYENPVIIYMRQEIMGQTEMSRITLKLLGILEGRALLRLVNKSKEELKTQAMVYAPPQPRAESKKTENDDDKPKSSKAKVGGSGSFAITKDMVKTLKKSTEPNKEEKEKKEAEAKEEPPEQPKYDWGNAPGRSMNDGGSKSPDAEIFQPEAIIEHEYNIIGERNAIMYTLNATQNQIEDLPDSFYDLTVHDLKMVLKDLRKVATGDEDAPLLTEKLRELENNNTMLRKISQYKNCAIRVQFPDRHVLQGMFKPIETISDVLEFTKKFLMQPKQPFFLFTIPPKTRLDVNKTLLELDFVPNALVHFSMENEKLNSEALLKKEFLEQLTSPEGALYAARKFRKQLVKSVERSSLEKTEPQSSSMSPSRGAIPKRPRNENPNKA